MMLVQGQRLYQYTDPTGKQYLSALPPAAGGPVQPRTPFFYTPMVVEEGMLSPHAGPPSQALRRQSIDRARVCMVCGHASSAISPPPQVMRGFMKIDDVFFVDYHVVIMYYDVDVVC